MPQKHKPQAQNKKLPTTKDLSQLFKKHPEVKLVRKIASLSEQRSIDKEIPLEQPNSYRF